MDFWRDGLEDRSATAGLVEQTDETVKLQEIPLNFGLASFYFTLSAWMEGQTGWLYV